MNLPKLAMFVIALLLLGVGSYYLVKAAMPSVVDFDCTMLQKAYSKAGLVSQCAAAANLEEQKEWSSKK
jgi:hypothetical protein